MVGNVKILHSGNTYYEIFVNGRKIDRVREINFHAEPCAIPEVDITLAAGCDFDGIADVGIVLNPETIEECIRGLRFALMTDDDLYQGFVSSICSALNDADNYTSNKKLSRQILDRIIGEEADVSI